MGYMSKSEFNVRLKQIQRKNKSKERMEKLKKEKSKYGFKINIETSKLFAIYLFVLFNAVLIYALIAMWEFGDLSYLGVLITDIAAQILLYGIYCMKAYSGKKQEEQMKFEKEKLFGFVDDDIDVDEGCMDENFEDIDLGCFDSNLDDDEIIVG